MFDPIPDLKEQVGAEIAKRIADRNQVHVALDLETDQPRVSDLKYGKLGRFSLETLIRYLSRLRCRITLTVEDIPRRFARPRILYKKRVARAEQRAPPSA